MLLTLLSIFCWYILPVIILCYFLLPDPPPLCGVYAQPGKFFFFKYCSFRILYWLRRKQQTRRDGKDQSAGYGMKSKSNVADMERLQELPESAPLAVDAVYFNACDQNGAYFVASSARRQNNVTQAMLLIRIPEVGLLQLPTHPDTSLKRKDEDSKGQFGAAGLTIEPVEPMKKWKIRYQGKLQLGENRLIDVTLSLDWTGCSDYFDFDTDMNPHALAVSIAREPWSREFFQRLRNAHQTHYEQFGDVKGVLKIDDSKKEYELKMRGARDHSYGKSRSWAQMHRYAMQFVHTADGTCFNAAVVSFPNVTMSRLEFGYVVTKSGKKMALKSIDLPLHKLGETKPAPTEYEFVFEDEEGTKYFVECEVIERPEVYFGENGNRDAVVLEQMCRYKVNGKPGWGISEWQYRYFDYKGTKCHN